MACPAFLNPVAKRFWGGYQDAQARSIPWDCTDWQAFTHADRTTAILESLAENRGKTLYCGIDQSDTFSKAETWQAGKDRNERDDTVYFGERGQFRGFIAAQEGWLTDGESGVTGVSIDRIFEFPREERRRTKRVKRIEVGTTLPDDAAASCGQVNGLICSEPGGESTFFVAAGYGEARRDARRAQAGFNADNRRINWETQAITNVSDPNNPTTAGTARPTAAGWQALAEMAATATCRARGARYVAGSAAFGKGHDGNQPAANSAEWTGVGLGWFYTYRVAQGNPNARAYQARQSRTWTATCKKTIRRTRK